MDFTRLTIAQVRKKLDRKEISSVELTKAYLERIGKLDRKLNAYITVTEKEALHTAKKADEKIAQGDASPLLGIPFSAKDMYLTKGIRTTAGSKVLENYIPQYSATVLEKMEHAGAVLVGKNNQDAWAHGASGEHSDFGPTKNPWNLAYIPGGSSSGPAVSVAADLASFAIATDTGGSIRQPASLCGITGLKPTYGRVSRYGVVAMASSFDTMGHFTRSVEDSALILSVTAGYDEHDATSSEKPVPHYASELKKNIKGLKIGMPKEYFTSGLDSNVSKTVKTAMHKLEELGAEIIPISLPHTQYGVGVYYILQTAEVSSNLARYDGIRYGNNRETFGDEAKRRIMLGTFVLAHGYYDAYYKRAMKIRTLIRQDFDIAFRKVDAIACPVSPTPAWKIGEKVSDPLAMYLADIFTVTANIAGIPGLAIPAGFAMGMPVGMQLLGPQFSEDILFRIGHQYQLTTDWHTRKPDLPV
ncbi:MAG TPA: Asp-tRNA(Asn)/Glu-tRNA(Gln) amidotransferase subunit GatA [Patescibacteria group bacterium]|nr:Asp-tRNA(Asn)/Glu-tRNA(Gln) amidotransferase subunit GatA [Patescibacteria group bacterium]